MNRRGSVAVIVAICMVTLIGFVGFAIDLERTFALKSRLQTSVDAAALLAAREINKTSMQADAKALFWANFSPAYSGSGLQSAGLYGSTATGLTFTKSADGSRVTMAASATLPMTFISVLPGAPTSLTVNDSATAMPGGSGLELALVLDTTESMSHADGSTNGTKLQAMQSAIASLLDILYGADTDSVNNLWVSVVPFITTINIGNGKSQQAWLASTHTALEYKRASTQYSWAGCVQARWSNDDDESEAAPAAHLFTPYFADDTYAQYGTSNGSNAACSSVKAYSNLVCMGDNDWGAPSTLSTSGNPSLQSGISVGPNRSCPTALLALTASKSTILTMVNSLTTQALGTMIGLGMQGGWLTLSPNWRGSAGWGATDLPHNYVMQSPAPSPLIQKAVVLVSDGDNNWSYAADVAPASQQKPTTLYMAYGRLSNTNNPLGISLSGSLAATKNNADAVLDIRWQAVCTNMKAVGIAIYVIGLGVSSSNARTQLQNCATSFSNYYESPTASTLNAAFTQIGEQLTNLRLTQ
ncbi:MAG: pilus assembly protein TadG-related protein [Janthinobacterium lividum]